jgi:Fe-S-cluster containining protein
MTEIVFECKKCGTCCRNLLEEIEGIAKGLILTAKEVSLFPSKMISPSIAIGTEKSKTMIFYQLNANTCPHIDKRNECLIYDRRPLMCRAFPYNSGNFSIKCPVFSNRRVGQFYLDFEPSELQIDADGKLDRYKGNRFRKYFKKGFKEWHYDLTKKNWVFKCNITRIPM